MNANTPISLDAVYQTLQLALHAGTGGEGKAPLLDMFHDYSYYVLVGQKSEQLATKCHELLSDLPSRHRSFYFKTVLNLGQQNCIINN